MVQDLTVLPRWPTIFTLMALNFSAKGQRPKVGKFTAISVSPVGKLVGQLSMVVWDVCLLHINSISHIYEFYETILSSPICIFVYVCNGLLIFWGCRWYSWCWAFLSHERLFRFEGLIVICFIPLAIGVLRFVWDKYAERLWRVWIESLFLFTLDVPFQDSLASKKYGYTDEKDDKHTGKA